MSEVTVKLKKPLQHGNETISALTIKPCKFKYLKGLSEDGFARTLTLASKLSGVPETVIGELEDEDIGAVSKVVNDFLLKCLRTGESSSQS